MEERSASPAPAIGRLTEVTGPFILSYLVGIAALAYLIYEAGVWDFLANTRLLDLFIVGGIVQLTDTDMGFFAGVPDVNHYLRSQEPIDLRLIGIIVGIYLIFGLVKAYQAHRLSLFAGVSGSLGQHGRAYIYGDALSRFLPFRMGDVANASALQGQGASPEAATRAVSLISLFTVFEIVVFSGVGIVLLGWTTWLYTLIWALVILIVSYFLLRPVTSDGKRRIPGRQWLREAGQMIYVMYMNRPLMLVGMAILSIVSFLLFELAAYLTAMAFTGNYVILNVEPTVVMAGLVAMYIVRLIPFTPGGIGPAEWAFAMALYYGGVGFPDAATIAILVSFFRHISSIITLAIVMPWHGIETNLGDVVKMFRLRAPEARAQTAGD